MPEEQGSTLTASQILQWIVPMLLGILSVIAIDLKDIVKENTDSINNLRATVARLETGVEFIRSEIDD